MVARRNFFPSPEQNQPAKQTRRSSRHAASLRGHLHQSSRQGKPSGAHQFSSNQVIPLPQSSHDTSEADAKKFRQKRAQHYRTRGFEALLVIAVNIALSGAALLALTRLVPYQTAQQKRLEEIKAEVASVEEKVNVLRAKLPKTFDSGKSQETLLRQKGWIKQNQLTIKLIEPHDSSLPTEELSLPANTTAQRALPRNTR